MENTWEYQGKDPIKIKRYLQSLGMGHRLFNDIKRGDGRFLVDHRQVRPTTMILPHQPLTIEVNPEAPDPSVKESQQPLNIVFEDDNWLVVNKPAGVVSIPGPHEDNDTVLNRVVGHLKAEGDDNLRPHLITRLDQYTAGLMLIAKHRVASSMISTQVEQHQMVKEYEAIVSGHLPKQHGQIDKTIKRVPDSPKRIIAADGQHALTEYWVEKTDDAHSLVRLRLDTGRTHQIRVHLASLHCPIVGDHLYDGDTTKFQHQLLAATKLAFTDPFTLKQREFTIDLPDPMREIAGQMN